MRFAVDADRLASELEELASISDAPSPAVTRIVFSGADLRARAWLKERCRLAGLHVREDAVGNTFARWQGSDASLPAVGTGSHIDAIPNAGRYDGTVGVLGGLEAIRSLKASGFSPARSIELLLFTSEEPTRFGLGCLGSRMLSGALPWQKAAPLRDHQQTTLDEVRQAAGFRGELARVRLPKNYYSAFLELHIEQGPLLEQQNVPLGLVQRIAAPASLRVTIDGQGGHAGAVLMPHRHDALTAAAELVLEVERIAQHTGSLDSVATTGVCDVFPGAVNSIPSRVSLGIDIRDVDLLRRDLMVQQTKQAAERVAQQRQTTATVDLLNADPPAACDQNILAVLRTSCEQENLTSLDMVSRAYHDSLFMSLIVPAAMLFIPCRAGVSHRPDEFASAAHIANGVRVLARALASLAS